MGTCFFSRKNSLFSYKGLTSIILTLLAFLGFVQLLSKASCHASQLCVCVCARARAMWPGCHLRLRDGCEVHDYTLIQSTSHVDLAGKLGYEQVASRLRDHWLMLLQIFKKRLKYFTPKYRNTLEIVHQH